MINVDKLLEEYTRALERIDILMQRTDDLTINRDDARAKVDRLRNQRDELRAIVLDLHKDEVFIYSPKLEDTNWEWWASWKVVFGLEQPDLEQQNTYDPMDDQ